MKIRRRPSSIVASLLASVTCLVVLARGAAETQPPDATPLPDGVRAVWDLAEAARLTTPTREKICLNGLWRWQPAAPNATTLPDGRWGFFKVPGAWPGITDYMQKDAQTLFAHPSWRDTRMRDLAAAWYQREITIPADWSGRRIALQADYVNSIAAVWLDGTRLGEIRFPGGELDLTAACGPGATHTLTLLVTAVPLRDVLLSFSDTNTAKEVKGRVARRGLCGDVFLASTPMQARIADARVSTSWRKKEIAVDVELTGLTPRRRYTLQARVARGGELVRTFSSPPFSEADLAAGHLHVTDSWMPAALWNLPTPQNTYDLTCSLVSDDGQGADVTYPTRFGFREFWIEGRDFYLNGTRLQLSVVPLDNAQVSAALASYARARESLLRLKSIGINFVYTHNYGCEPGSHLSFEEILRAADDVGMLVSLSQPHFSHYDWKPTEAERTNGYALHAAYYVRVAGNHPSVVAYAMNHNSTGYMEDMNPDLIDGLHDPRERAAQNNARLALRAEAIVKAIDPSRVIYHHSSGNLGSMHTINFYPNFVPIQELSDWFGHWATVGVKPLFLCEYGAPFTWDWTMYRGWYKGTREFGSAAVPWEFCLAEWNAQFLGDRAFQLSQAEIENTRWEARQFAAGQVWHRWDYPHQVGGTEFNERYPVFALYLADNWPAFRTWGVSAISPWEFGHYWKLRPSVDRRRQDYAVDWAHLQRPGFSADYEADRYERFDLAYRVEDWMATPAAETLLRYNQPLLAYLAGKSAAFTSKDHIFRAGETVEKQLIVINNSRARVTCDATWSLEPVSQGSGDVGLALAAMPSRNERDSRDGTPASGGPTVSGHPAGTRTFDLAAGAQLRMPLSFQVPAAAAPGKLRLTATVRFENVGGVPSPRGESQRDELVLQVMPPPSPAKPTARVALFDPTGHTAKLLQQLGVAFEPANAGTSLAGFDLLVVGQSALSPDAAAPDISRVREGLKVLIFEQSSATLERRFGFRVAEYGLRRVFRRVPDHPALAGLNEDLLHDWRGSATLLPAQITYETRPRYQPIVRWCNLPVTRLWRCGSRGNVASVLIEKPARGDFLPLLDGGFDLQYSPLLEYHEGRGVIVFCQMDVTDRTEDEPVAKTLVQNLMAYVSSWQGLPVRPAVYAGAPAGRAYLESLGITCGEMSGNGDRAVTGAGEALSASVVAPMAARNDELLILGPGARNTPGLSPRAIADFLGASGHIFALGLDPEDAATLLPSGPRLVRHEHITAYFPPPSAGSPFAGIGPGDMLNRVPTQLPLVIANASSLGHGASLLGDGVLATTANNRFVFCQFVPWQFDSHAPANAKRTFRRAAFALNRALANLGVRSTTPLLERFHTPVNAAQSESRWLHGFYLDVPEEWDDPYRFFRW